MWPERPHFLLSTQFFKMNFLPVVRDVTLSSKECVAKITLVTFQLVVNNVDVIQQVPGLQKMSSTSFTFRARSCFVDHAFVTIKGAHLAKSLVTMRALVGSHFLVHLTHVLLHVALTSECLVTLRALKFLGLGVNVVNVTGQVTGVGESFATILTHMRSMASMIHVLMMLHRS